MSEVALCCGQVCLFVVLPPSCRAKRGGSVSPDSMAIRKPKSLLSLAAKTIGLLLLMRLLYASWGLVAGIPLPTLLQGQSYRSKATTPISSADRTLGHQITRQLPSPTHVSVSPTVEPQATGQAESTTTTTTTASSVGPSSPEHWPGAATEQATSQGVLSESTIASFVHAILNPDATDPARLECPRLDEDRYRYLQVPRSPYPSRIKYFFVLDLRRCLEILPRLLGSIVEVVRFLGPEVCAMSIVEGSSSDGTDEVLRALQGVFPSTFHLHHTTIDSLQSERIARLAELRNLAMAPMLEWASHTESALRPDGDTIVIFSNDVAPCAEDFLELLHQRLKLGADMVCPMDWSSIGAEPTFYDVWVSRDMSGNGFFAIGADGGWERATELFPVDHDAAERYRDHAPFQVFSCWNGMAVFRAEPVLLGKVAFRVNKKNVECFQGEPQLFCKDLWHNGYGKIAVVPSVNLEYSNENARKIKALKGYTSNLVGNPAAEQNIDWKMEPPPKVRCMEGFAHQFMQDWDAGLT